MERIKKITLRVNQNEKVFYEYNGEKFDTETEVLRRIFKDQGELYEKVYNVDRETAKLVEWHPEDKDFDTDSEGWQNFLRDEGRIHKEEIVEEFSIEEFVHNYTGF